MLSRPTTDEYAEYYETYTKRVPEGAILELMDSELEATLALLASVPAVKDTVFRAGHFERDAHFFLS